MSSIQGQNQYPSVLNPMQAEQSPASSSHRAAKRIGDLGKSIIEPKNGIPSHRRVPNR